MNLFKQKFQRSRCSNSLLPEVLSSPQRQNRRGGVEPQYFRQSALKACYSLFSCMVLFIFYVSKKSRFLERFLLEFFKCPFIQTNENKNKSYMQARNNRTKQLNMTNEIVFLLSLLAVSEVKIQTKDLSVTLV